MKKHTNKTRNHFPKVLGLILLIVLALGLGTAALAEGLPATSETTATVSFLDGDLELDGKIGGSGLNFDFGQHSIPAESVSYPAENAGEEGVPVDHALQVVDTRMASGDWFVTVSMTSFTAQDETAFDAMIQLANATYANANETAGTEGLTVEEDVRVSSGGGSALVMEADDTLPRGIYTVNWKNKDVTLNISDSEVLNLGTVAYSAELSWTLNVGP